MALPSGRLCALLRMIREASEPDRELGRLSKVNVGNSPAAGTADRVLGQIEVVLSDSTSRM